MFCASCGKEIADNSTQCPECGAVFATASAPEAAGAAEAPKAPSKYDTNVGGFIGEFVKSPVKSILSRTEDSYWLWGLISLGAILLITLFQYGFREYVGFGYGFKVMLALAFAFAALIFVIFLLQGSFKLQKKSLPSVVGAVGLSFVPLIPLMLVSIILTAIGLPGSPFTSVGYIISALIVYSFLQNNDEEPYTNSFWLTAIAYVSFYIIQAVFLRVIAL
jgi:hypothetical protein